MTAPIISDSAQRAKNIIENKPAIFNLEDNPKANIYYNKNLENPKYGGLVGRASIENNKDIIIKLSKEQNLDSNLVAAIFYMENSHGWYAGMGKIADDLNVSKSKFPGNIQPMWNKLAGEHGNVNNLEDNIKASITLIKRISERIENPTVERVATLYNSLAKEKVTNYGARVGEIFRTNPWGERLETNIIIKSEKPKQIQSKNYEQSPNYDTQIPVIKDIWKILPYNLSSDDNTYKYIKNGFCLDKDFASLNPNEQDRYIKDFITQNNQQRLDIALQEVKNNQTQSSINKISHAV